MIRRTLVPLLVLGSLVVAPAAADAASRSTVTVSAPAHVTEGRGFGLTLRVASRRPVAGFEAQVFVDGGAAVIAGTVVEGEGTRTLGPTPIGRGVSIAAYGLHVSSGRLAAIALNARGRGRVEIRVARVLLVDARGRRIPARLVGSRPIVRIGARSGRFWPAPRIAPAASSTRVTSSTADLTGDGRVDAADVADASLDWIVSHDPASHSTTPSHDVDGDHRVTVGDVQRVRSQAASPASIRTVFAGPLTGLVVNTTSDLADATPGNGICATSLGECSLRAAITEGDANPGPDTITFNIPTATGQPVITLTSRLPSVTQQFLTVDGQTQPGAVPNTSPTVFNGTPGVTIRGTGIAARQVAFFVPSSFFTVQGIRFENIWRDVWLTGTNSRSNTVAGNVFTGGEFNVLIDGGAHLNRIGIPSLAGRNVLGNSTDGVNMYGANVVDNTIQNNLIGISPDGLTPWGVANTVDHNFGPSRNLTGGTGPLEGNVLASGRLTGVEISHGWNPALPPRQDQSVQYQNNDNRVIGNVIGFRPDGAYDPAFANGTCYPSCNDNGQAVNIIDGSNRTIVQGNFLSSLRNAVQISATNSTGNVIRGNVIGVSPSGQAAVINQYGIRVELGSQNNEITGNTIANTGLSGIAVLLAGSNGIKVSQNAVTSSGATLGIDLFPLGVVNDASVAGSAANRSVVFPTITSATPTFLEGSACAGCSVELFKASGVAGGHGGTSAYLGSTTASLTGGWSFTPAPAAIATGDLVTGTATTATADSSEFGLNVAVTATPAPLATDSFTRTLASGWGSAETGGPWTLLGNATGYAVNGAVGTMTMGPGETREATLGAVNATSLSIASTVAFDRTPVAGKQFAYLQLRKTGTTAYRATLRVELNGAVFAEIFRIDAGVETKISSSIALTALQQPGIAPVRMRFSAIGTSPTALAMTVWQAGQSEPASPTVTASDATAAQQAAGTAGVRAYLARSATNGPLTASFDDVEVRTAP